METPIIDPNTLTEEQREKIRERIEHLRSSFWGTSFENRVARTNMRLLEWLFGESIFEKEENNE